VIFLLVPADIAAPYMLLKKSTCSLNIGKIVLVQMVGEYESRIQDDTRANAILNDDQNRQSLTVTLYEDTIYRLHVQLDCGGQLGRDPFGNVCDLSQNVNVWIDFNDNGFDNAERRVLRRPSSNSYISSGTYDLEISIPLIDGRNTKAGLHRMRLAVMPSKKYRRECGTVKYKETREYTVNIVPKATYPGKSLSFKYCLVIYNL
jgi:hypothetical protein